ncbi:MAG: hypothetical protein ACNS64_03335, partial [Candidatus Halalkalibacterium sp. M3_1C_030]
MAGIITIKNFAMHYTSIFRKIFLIGFAFFLSYSICKAQDYYVYVALESEDEVSLIRFNGETEQGTIEKTV